MRPRSPRPPAWYRALALGWPLGLPIMLGVPMLAQGGCYDGPGELEPEPGSPGGLCLELNACSEVFWTCDPVGAFCYNPGVPCQGILCGGHGECTIDEANGLPQCTCEPGYGNFEFSLYCESL